MRVAIIGNFDGVHGGHRALIRRAREYAGDGPRDRVVAVTFDRHPAAVLRPDQAPAALTTTQRRSVLLREAGADEVVVLPFTPELASRTPEEFARLLREDPAIAADAVIVGHNFRFGAKAAGDTAMLTSLGRDLGFVVEVVPLVSEGMPDRGGLADPPGQDDIDGAWSSTRIRASIAAGELEEASAMLGRPHRLEGTVVRGDQRGRELGYPTANVEVVTGLAIPPDGVYAGWLVVAGESMPAAVSIGTNPQFSGSERRVEAYAIGRDDLDIYGDSVAVDLVARLRGQEVFASVEELVEQMGRDVAAAQAVLTG